MKQLTLFGLPNRAENVSDSFVIHTFYIYHNGRKWSHDKNCHSYWTRWASWKKNLSVNCALKSLNISSKTKYNTQGSSICFVCKSLVSMFEKLNDQQRFNGYVNI